MIQNYFKNIQKLLGLYHYIIEDQTLTTKTYTETSGFVAGEVCFVDESALDFIEVVDTGKALKNKYKYHYMNKEKEMIFRYDNAPHHKDVSTFPHHKHVNDTVIESQEPDLNLVLSEIEQNILKK
jgi:hypothetical protein